jgi:predicted amidohydrolase YtcJ
MKRIGTLLVSLLFLCSCTKSKVDLIIYNAKIYTVNNKFDIVEAMAIKEGKIVSVGSSTDIRKKYNSSEEVDADQKAIFPGFIDAHAHFFGYGESLQSVNLTGTKSWEEVLERTLAFAKTHPDGWLTGRGWDQNDWANKQFPTKEKIRRNVSK